MAFVEPGDLSVQAITRTDSKDFLHSSLANQKMRTVLARDHDRKAAASKIEGNFIDLRISADPQFLFELSMFKHGLVEQISQSRLEVAVEKGVLKHPLRVPPLNIDVPLEDDPILRQRARFVGAQHIHGAEVLNSVETFDDDLLARHRNRALGEID